MLKHIKLTTISRLFATLMLLTCIILGLGTLFLEKNISLIGSNWELFQTDGSEKSRLESALRASIGYGGMIHEFKNYILRQDPVCMDRTQAHIGAAKSVLQQYGNQEITAAESVALEDIKSVLQRYEQALMDAEQLIKQGKSIGKIDMAVRIDDAPALRGLQTLREEMRHTLAPDSPLSKARINADLRAAIGYGGMIHEFKNYVLRHDASRVAVVKEKLAQAHNAIAQYHHLDPSNAETLALDDIERTLLSYGEKLQTITRMIALGTSNKEIDQRVSINDQPAFRGLSILNREINRQVMARSDDVSNALSLVERTLSISTWGVITLLLFLLIVTVGLMQYHIISPILRLTKGMVKLANNDIAVTFDDHNRNNELGDMARTVMVFKENIIERDKAEKQLAHNNEQMNLQLENIQRLREQSEEQTTKALALAEGLTAAQKTSEKAIARAEEDEKRIRSILDAVRDAVITIDTKGIIENFNPGAEDMFGYKAHIAQGKNISMIMPEPARSEHDGYLKRMLASNSSRDHCIPVDAIAMHRDGNTFPVAITLNTMRLGDEVKIIGVVRDITEQKKREEEIKRLAMTDPLTGLANRHQYNQRLDEAVALSKRLKHPFALLLIDLDKFKPVNDTYGHPAGDALLQHVAQCLIQSCRETDTVARLGGDEFAVILAPTEEKQDADIPAQRIIEQLSQPVSIGANTITISASIGISYYPTLSTDIEELQHQADIALYQAKKSGRKAYRTFHNVNEPTTPRLDEARK
jgi:diguanylate cyclase (GGDEF)-like protein/PAS domain S-box-containing protein